LSCQNLTPVAEEALGETMSREEAPGQERCSERNSFKQTLNGTGRALSKGTYND
jgi:hypothetical protein